MFNGPIINNEGLKIKYTWMGDWDLVNIYAKYKENQAQQNLFEITKEITLSRQVGTIL